jgi:hypothetical protein
MAGTSEAVTSRKGFDTCKSGRPRQVVLDERAKEYAKLITLWNAVAVERERRAKRDARIELAKVKWMQDHPGEPFDPTEFSQDMTPIPIDIKIHEEFRVQHLVLRALDDEIEGRVEE